MDTEKMGNITAIKKFFGDVSMPEFKNLNSNDREELGKLCLIELKKM